MNYSTNKELQLQFIGFLHTPFLWNNDLVELTQYKALSILPPSFSMEKNKKLRLGKLVEKFVSFELQQSPSISIIAENVQLQKEKITVGELDCLYKDGNQIIHLEIIYKFYLYHFRPENTEIEHWIGPNKKDSLKEKLHKLKTQQLPVLYSEPGKNFLKSKDINYKNILQKVYFKAQLFIPIHTKNILFDAINEDCVYGFYASLEELSPYKEGKFYLPTKHNWLQTPHSRVDWLNFSIFEHKVLEFLEKKISPLVWLKKTNGEILKLFVVWW